VAISNTHTAAKTSFLTVGVVKRGLMLSLLLVLALVVSIVCEWVGLLFFWPEQGTSHSHNMIVNEVSYLQRSTLNNPFISSTDESIASSIRFIDQVYGFVAVNVFLQDKIEWLALGIVSAINITKVFVLRLLVMALSTPTFLVFGLVGFVRGLSAREIRRWGVGRESSGMYGLYIKLLPETFFGLWFVYLSMPFSLNPFYIVGPAAIMFSVLIANTSYRFKKYK